MRSLSGIGGRLYRGETSIDFIGKRRRWYAFSGVIIAMSAIVLGTQGLNLGIEFKGGSEFSISKPGVTVEQGRAAMEEAGVAGESVVQIVGNDRLRIQTGTLESFNTVKESLAKSFGVNVNDIDTQIIGPSWGAEITKKALYGLVGFIIVVMLFLAMIFEPKMAFAAIVATVHDVVVTVGIYALVGFDVTPATVIGFLTILGYSLYDTVVVFDKVRENTKSITSTSKVTYSAAANLAVNQTLVRSFNTSVIALLPVGSILFVGSGLLGAGTLKDLSLALFVGLATGTYSSIFIATPLLAQLREREPAMRALAKRVAQHGPGAVSAEAKGSTSVAANAASAEGKNSWARGPRNQPKRKRR
jgi:preprotein translocase subunit SecF